MRFQLIWQYGFILINDVTTYSLLLHPHTLYSNISNIKLNGFCSVEFLHSNKTKNLFSFATSQFTSTIKLLITLTTLRFEISRALSQRLKNITSGKISKFNSFSLIIQQSLCVIPLFYGILSHHRSLYFGKYAIMWFCCYTQITRNL